MKITNHWNEVDSDYIRKKLIEYNLTKIPEEVKHAVKNVSSILRKVKVIFSLNNIDSLNLLDDFLSLQLFYSHTRHKSPVPEN